MRKATSVRELSKCGDWGAFSNYVSDSGFKCGILERPLSAPEHPAIEPGIFICELAVSPAFFRRGADFGFGRGVVYHVRNVPNRSHILIHPANWAVPIKTAANDNHMQLEGCLAPGTALTKVQVPAPDGRMLMGIISSRAATIALMRDMAGEKFELTIKNG